MSSLTPPELAEAIERLWRLPAGTTGIGSTPEFGALKVTCSSLYPTAAKGFALDIALHSALRSLGMPCELGTANLHLALQPDVAAAELNAAFEQKMCTRIYLCPLELLDTFPDLRFGPNEIRTLSPDELDALANVPRLTRVNSQWLFDSKRFSQFSWLVVREKYALSRTVGERVMPFLNTDMGQDFGRIEPHSGKFPEAVEAALFALCLLPWEHWSGYAGLNWRGFQVPWVYTVDDDLFIRPAAPPSPDSLAWETKGGIDAYGNTDEYEAPTTLPLSEDAKSAPSLLDDAAWTALENARGSPLFREPMAHFLVRAFASSGIDEFMAHIIAVEAALGQAEDRRKPGGMTKQVADRLAAALSRPSAADDFSAVHQRRNEFVHGREMTTISSGERRLARTLAREAIQTVVNACANHPHTKSRSDFLDALLSARP